MISIILFSLAVAPGLEGFELTILQDESCLARAYRAWGEAYEEGVAWKAQWRGPLNQTMSLEELPSFFNGKPVIPDQEIQNFLTGENYYLRFQFHAHDGFNNSTQVASKPIKLSDLTEENQTIYNQYNDQE